MGESHNNPIQVLSLYLLQTTCSPRRSHPLPCGAVPTASVPARSTAATLSQVPHSRHTLQAPQPSSRVCSPLSSSRRPSPPPGSHAPLSSLKPPHCRWGQTQTPSRGWRNSPPDIPTATSTPSRPADPQLTLTEDLASAALSAWKVPPPDHHVAGFVTCFSSKRTFSEMPFLTPLLKQPPVWLCLRLSVLISSQQSLPSSMTLCIYTGLCLTPQHPALKCTSHDNRKLVCLPHHSDLPCSGRV